MDHPSLYFMMSIDTFVWVAGIIGYGLYQYRKRGLAHRWLIRNLIEGKEITSIKTDASAKPIPWRLWTIGFVEILLIGAIVWLLSLHSTIRYGGYFVYIIAGVFFALFLMLVSIVFRDFKRHQDQRKANG
jgi:hypothetical protein